MALILACDETNDLHRALCACGCDVTRCDEPSAALDRCRRGDGLVLLADGYPAAPQQVDLAVLEAAADKGCRVYVEFPAALPGQALGAPREVTVERGVVASDAFAPALEAGRILTIHGCRYVPAEAEHPYLVLARVAGFDRAVFGLPAETHPVLFEASPHLLVATTKLSQFRTARYGPQDAWQAVWRWILRWAGGEDVALTWTPSVRPTHGPAKPLAGDAEDRAVARGVRWFFQARLPVHPAWKDEAHRRLHAAHHAYPRPPQRDWPIGDGSLGLLEGPASQIHPDGRQAWRYLLRNDCMGEASMALALAGQLTGDAQAAATAANVNDFIYEHSVLAGGPRADPANPAYGLVGWHTRDDAPGIYYGDDNARALLGTLAAAAALGEPRWDRRVALALLANLRTTGPLGFRGNALRQADLEEHGWRHYWMEPRENFAPHFESWLWACFLWASARSGLEPFLQRAREGLGRTMAAYPDQWRWTNGLQQERARMLLPLAWLLRVEDTSEHRGWLERIADDLLAAQQPCGAIREEIGSAGLGRYGPPATNEAYGTTEAPLIQENGDPLCDLLYTTNFAFIGLREAAGATGDARYRQAEDKLADLLCRIQVRSEEHPDLDGAWFRAFEYRRWETWASNADHGWGPWSVESGWTQAWIVATLALRRRRTCLWDLTAGSDVGRHLRDLAPEMIPTE